MGISTFTGNPVGNLNVMKSRSFEKCLKGAIISKTFRSISTDRGKSELCFERFIFKVALLLYAIGKLNLPSL